MAPRKLPIGEGHYGAPLGDLRKAVHTILSPDSRGCHLSPAMRLVATMMLLWEEDWSRLSGGRYGMTVEEIADRTSLEPRIVRATLAKMVDVRLIRERTDGWELTWKTWYEEALKPWVAHANARHV